MKLPRGKRGGVPFRFGVAIMDFLRYSQTQIKNPILGPGELDPWLKALAALAEFRFPAPTLECKSSSRRVGTSALFPAAQAYGVCTYVRNMHIHTK